MIHEIIYSQEYLIIYKKLMVVFMFLEPLFHIGILISSNNICKLYIFGGFTVWNIQFKIKLDVNWPLNSKNSYLEHVLEAHLSPLPYNYQMKPSVKT